MQETLYNIAFERSVISSIIFDPASFEDIVGILKESDFYLPAHANIYSSINSLYNKNTPIDEEFLKQDLIKNNAYHEQVLLEIMVANPISNTKAYIEEIVDKSRVRSLIGLSSTIKKHALEENESSDTIISRIETDLQAIVNHNSSTIEIIDINDIQDSETEFVLKECLPLPVGTVSIVAAPGGTGKSWLANQIALRFCSQTNKSAVLWLSEDPLSESKSRAYKINKEILNNDSQINNIRYIESSSIHLIQNKKFSYADFYKIRRALRLYDLIVFDPTLGFYGGDENDNSQARMFMQPFMNWAKEENKTIIFLHHSRKSGDGSKVRGAGAFVDACRTVYEMETVDGDDNSGKRNIILSKDNLGAIKHLNAFKVKRQITPSRREIKVAYETVYDSGSDSILNNDTVEVVVI